MDSLINRFKSKKTRHLYDISPFYYQCSSHANSDCISACVTCVELLCQSCLQTHCETTGTCKMIDFNKDRVHDACDVLKSSIIEKMKCMNHSVKNIYTEMVNKKKRMLRKKHETALEIELFFNRLRSRIDQKLKTEEQTLLDRLETKVSEEDATLDGCIRQCNNILQSLTQKNTAISISEVRKLDTTLVSRYLKFVLQTGEDLNQIETHRSDLLLTLNALLVIRLSIDSETQESMLHKPVAEVEVIHSCFDDTSMLDGQTEPLLVDIGAPPITPNYDIQQKSTNTTVDPVFEYPLRVQLSNTECRATSLLDEPLIDFTEISPAQDCQGQQNGTTARSSQTAIDNMYGHGLSPILNTDQNTVSSETALIRREDTDTTIVHGNDTNTGGSFELDVHGSNDAALNVSSVDTLDIQRIESTNNPGEPIYINMVSVARPISSAFSTNTQEDIVPTTSTSLEVTPTNPTQTPVDNPASHAHTNDTSAPEHCNVASLYPDEPPPPYAAHAPMSPLPSPEELPPPYSGLAPPPYSQTPPTEHRHRQGRRRLRTEHSPPTYRHIEGSRSLSPNLDSRHSSGTQSLFSDVIQPKGPLVVFSNSEMNDHRAPGIISMTAHNGNSFLFIDRWNKKLKYFSGMGISIGGLIFREEPWDIAKIHDDMYAVTVPKLKTVYKIRAEPQSVLTIGTINTFRQYACLAFDKTNTQLICGQVPQFGEPLVEGVSLDTGCILFSLRKDSSGLDFLSYPRYVKVINNGNCVVCDWNQKCLIFFKLDGTMICYYKGTRDHPLNEPTGIEVDAETNTVYVIDAKFTEDGGAIHAVTMDGECSAIYGGPADFRDARALALVKNKLAVGSRNGVLSVYMPRRRYRTRHEI